jgi:predicted dehydrogenase
MNGRLPREVTGRILAEAGGGGGAAAVPSEFSGELVFEDGVSAGFYSSFVTELQQWANVSGTGGYLQVSDFVLPYAGDELSFETQNATYATESCRFAMNAQVGRVTVPEPSHGQAGAQESRMFRAFHESVLSGKPDPQWADWALKTQRVVNGCLDSARQGGGAVVLD